MASQRKLAAILFTDIVGSTAATARSESAGLALRDRHRGLVRPLVEAHRGRVIEAPGDQSLSIFESAVDAAHCALAIQQAVGADAELRLHIGVHLGEIVLRDDEVFGDGINVAARICALSDGSAPYVSDEVAQAIRGQENLRTKPLGTHDLKNVGRPVAVHALEGEAVAPAAARSRRRRVAPWAVGLVGGVALVAIAIAAYLTYGGRSQIAAGPPLTSIAVLPFDDMSPGADQKWLADGLAEELIETLSRVEAFRVAARTSAFALEGKDIATVGAKLRVGSVVEGSLRRSDDQVRVTAQLIRVSDGYHLWSARYDRKVSDVFALQAELARAITEAVSGELGVERETSWRPAHEPSDVRAYELVKQGFGSRYPLLTEAGIRKGIEFYEQALAIDPDYAQAHAELGYAYYELWTWHGRAEADLSRSRAQAERALASDATNGSAHELLAITLYSTYQWEEARRALDEGLAHNPGHSGLRADFATVLVLQGRTPEALVEIRRAADLDPWFWLWHWGVGFVQSFAGEYDAAVEHLERAWKLAPGAPLIRSALAHAYHRTGRDREALEAAVRDLPPELAKLETAMRRGFAEAGFLGALRREVEWRVATRGEPCSNEPWLAADSLALLGEADSMFACLEKAIERKDRVFLKANPVYDPYRSDPRFTALLRRMNLAE